MAESGAVPPAAAANPLPGGFVNTVVRIGDTVRRPMPKSANYVHQLLRHLHDAGWPHAPRVLGRDDEGREMLSWIDGAVPWQPQRQVAVRTRAGLIRVAELLREFHDLTAGTDLAAGAEVVCHNDLSPKNTVYLDSGSGLVPVAFLDWDNAGPGQRVQDVAHACWQFVGLGRAGTTPAQAVAGLRLIADAYGLADRSELVATILWWQDRCWRGIDAQADAGEPAMVRLRQGGAVMQVRAEYNWTATHEAVLQAAL